MLVSRKMQVAGKIESSSGTAESITTAEATVNFYEPDVQYDVPFIEMPKQDTSSEGLGVVGAKSLTLTGFTYMTGKGASGDAPWTYLLRSCGVVGTSGVWGPVTGDTSTATMQFNRAGNLHKMAGAAGNLVMNGTFGQPVKMNWRHLGKVIAPASASLLAPTRDVIKPQRFAASTGTVGAAAYKLASFEFDTGNQVTLIPDATDASDSGYFAANVMSRRPTITLTIAAPLISAHNFFDDYLSSTTRAISILIGAGTNLNYTLAIPKGQLIEMPKEGDYQGMVSLSMKYQMVANSDAGDDEWTLTAA